MPNENTVTIDSFQMLEYLFTPRDGETFTLQVLKDGEYTRLSTQAIYHSGTWNVYKDDEELPTKYYTTQDFVDNVPELVKPVWGLTLSAEDDTDD